MRAPVFLPLGTGGRTGIVEGQIMFSQLRRPPRVAVMTALALFAGASMVYASVTGSSGDTATSGYVQLPSSGTTTASSDRTALAATTGTTALSATSVPDVGSFSLGVQTHMSQGWTLSTITQAKQVRAGMLRDSVPWTINEAVKGRYDFGGSGAGAIARACAAGFPVMITLPPQHPFYDGGKMVYTSTGQTAYAKYIKAVLDKFGTSCITGIEVGNEINGANAPEMLASGKDMITVYMGILRRIDEIVRPAHPNVRILGGSTNMIGTGFLERLFAAGMLPLVEGVVVHPYRSQAQGVDLEIANLVATMKKYGAPKPIWATEWSHDLTDQKVAAGELIKQVAMLSASGVKQASWYALVDQIFYPHMGLIAGSSMKQQGNAYELVQRTLVPKGRAKRVDFGDPLFFAYRFGTNNWAVWGSPRTIKLSGGQAYSATGASLGSGSVQVGASPIVIVGGDIASASSSNLVADTLLGYGSKQWAYYARMGTKKQTDYPLSFVNDHYSSYFGGRGFMPLRLALTRAVPGGDADSAIRPVMRYTASSSQSLELWACMSKSAARGDGVDYLVSVNGTAVKKGITTTRTTLSAIPVSLSAGDNVDFVIGPNKTYGGDSVNYRVQLYKRGTGSAPTCT